MLRRLLKLFYRARQKPSLLDHASNNVVLFAEFDTTTRENLTAATLTTREPSVLPLANHRERLLSMKLEHTKLCSIRRCERLQCMGMVTTGDLARADLTSLAERFGAPSKALPVLKRYHRAIRFAASVPGMMPRDALLLISIHRRSVRGLALESPARLYRDLERFAESTQGRKQLRGRRIPSVRRLKKWITECETVANASPFHTLVA